MEPGVQWVDRQHGAHAYKRISISNKKNRGIDRRYSTELQIIPLSKGGQTQKTTSYMILFQQNIQEREI